MLEKNDNLGMRLIYVVQLWSWYLFRLKNLKNLILNILMGEINGQQRSIIQSVTHIGTVEKSISDIWMMCWFYRLMFVSVDHRHKNGPSGLNIWVIIPFEIPPDAKEIQHFYETDETEAESEPQQSSHCRCHIKYWRY